MGWVFRKKMVMMAIMGLCAIIAYGITIDVNAGSNSGSGNDTSGQTTNCSGFINGYQYLCGDNGSKGGGAAWHIYSTSGDRNDWPVYVSAILDNGGVTVDDILTACPANEYSWFVAYGWVRSGTHPDANEPGSNGVIRLTGPANRFGAIAADGTQYNSYGALGERAIKDTMQKGGNLNNIRITQGAAESLYAEGYKSSVIPSDVGYFCVSDDVASGNFQGTSRVLVGDAAWGETPNEKKSETTPLWWPDGKKKTGIADTLVVDNCDPVNGCEVSFRHYLKRRNKNVEGNTRYSVIREIDGKKQSIKTNELNNGINNNNNVLDNKITMFPGEKVCETLRFLADGDGGSEEVTTTACAVAVAEVGSNISARIRDEGSANVAWGERVYAKPGDTVEIEGSYEPLYQSMYNVSLPNSDKTIGQAFDSANNPKWNNAFNIKIEDNCGGGFGGSVGNAGMYSGIHTYTVQEGDAGKEKQAWAVTNCEESAKTTPKKVSVKYSDVNGFSSEIDTDATESNAVKMIVPYNFENSVKIDIDEDKDVFYAGETVSLSFKLVVGDKYNKYTSKDADDKYATSVPGAEWGIQVKYDNEGYSDVAGIGGKGDLNVNESNEHSESANIPVRDVVAGTEICVRVWMTPGNSGSDDNLSPSGFSGDAQDEVCVKVAKRPSFQVWGGSAYSASMIDAPSARKTDIAIEGFDGKARTFGSWTELALVAKGKNEIMASGAGFGYDGGIGGSIDGSAYNTLTTSNEHSLVGGLASVLSDTTVGMPDKDSLEETLKDKGYYKVEGNVGDILSGPSLEDEPKRLYMTDSDIELNFDIDINRSRATYNNFAETPSIIVYTTGDIKIGCNVKTIDAVLIAGKTIDTCAGYDEDVLKTTRNGANLLRINGVLSASRIELNRTGGASVGAQSIEPAEVVNYDSSLLVSSKYGNSESESSILEDYMVQYMHELAPRY